MFRKTPTRTGSLPAEASDTKNWPEMEAHHTLSPYQAMLYQLQKANRFETYAGVWKRRLFNRWKRQDPRRDQASLDRFLGEDPIWRGMVLEQQFGNREAQMYGTVAQVEEQRRTNELLQKILEELRGQHYGTKSS